MGVLAKKTDTRQIAAAMRTGGFCKPVRRSIVPPGTITAVSFGGATWLSG